MFVCENCVYYLTNREFNSCNIVSFSTQLSKLKLRTYPKIELLHTFVVEVYFLLHFFHVFSFHFIHIILLLRVSVFVYLYTIHSIWLVKCVTYNTSHLIQSVLLWVLVYVCILNPAFTFSVYNINTDSNTTLNALVNVC